MLERGIVGFLIHYITITKMRSYETWLLKLILVKKFCSFCKSPMVLFGYVMILTEDDFLSLFARIWIEIHFSLESPIVNFGQVIIQFICRYIYVTQNRQQGCVIRKQFSNKIKTGCQIINVNQKQHRTQNGSLGNSCGNICPVENLSIQEKPLNSIF